MLSSYIFLKKTFPKIISMVKCAEANLVGSSLIYMNLVRSWRSIATRRLKISLTNPVEKRKQNPLEEKTEHTHRF